PKISHSSGREAGALYKSDLYITKCAVEALLEHRLILLDSLLVLARVSRRMNGAENDVAKIFEMRRAHAVISFGGISKRSTKFWITLTASAMASR
ncbi:hypothetical protein, partial [Bradyrhizobium liaoningense]|uniref:hypothetical protein n=1 Tax=Bradyrhizobium liaoningense TaxID=43992 RepID=UPI001AEC062F